MNFWDFYQFHFRWLEESVIEIGQPVSNPLTLNHLKWNWSYDPELFIRVSWTAHFHFSCTVQFRTGWTLLSTILKGLKMVKGSSDPSHFTLKIKLGKSRIRHTTTLKWNDEIQDRSKINWKWRHFRVVLCRIRIFPTLIAKIKWLRSWLPLKLGKNPENRLIFPEMLGQSDLRQGHEFGPWIWFCVGRKSLVKLNWPQRERV